jgi:Transposase DDE domain
MASKTINYFLELSTTFINLPESKVMFRMSSTHFTRNKKLPFESVVLILLRGLRKSISMELFTFLKSSNSTLESISASAFVQQRKKINPDFFYKLNNHIAVDYYKDNDENVQLYKGHRVLAIDGSTINLPVSKELKQTYQLFNNQHKTNDVILGRVSILYDVLNNIVLDGLLGKYEVGEITLSKSHFTYAQKNDLIIMDRGYPSFESAYLMGLKGINYLFRCKEDFSNVVKEFTSSCSKDAVVTIKSKQNKSFLGLAYNYKTEIKVRLLKIEIALNEYEILMTSLLDVEKYPHNSFKELYFKRWSIETFYDRFKNIIGVEQFSGTSEQFIQQEFNCALYISNIHTLFMQDAQKKCNTKYTTRKYDYKINSSLTLSVIRTELLTLFLEKNTTQKLLDKVELYFVKNVIPIRPNRKYERDINKYRQRTKPKQFANRRVI